MIDYQKLVQNCDEAIRRGEIARAAHPLRELNLARIPKVWCLPLAKTCRRAGLTTSGLKILTPIVLSPQRRLSTVPTEEELSEYAILLQRNGSVREAQSLLSRLDGERVPDALL